MENSGPNRLTPAGGNFKRKQKDLCGQVRVISQGSRKADGEFGERLAERFLLSRGYSLVERNFFIRGGEIDLVMKKNGILVFAEVKLRGGTDCPHPSELIGTRKKIRLLRAIRTYLKEKKIRFPWRCDLVLVRPSGHRKANITIFRNIYSE